MTTTSGWCLSGHCEGCRFPETCPCMCHEEDS